MAYLDLMSRPYSEAALKVLEERYLQSGENPDDMWRRVAQVVAAGELLYQPDPEGSAGEEYLDKVYEERRQAAESAFFDVMASRKFVPGSPILSNAGKSGMCYSSCFVLPIEDSLASIMETAKNTALIHKAGGGTGFAFSRLRPKGSRVESTKQGAASGPVGFLRMYDAITEEVKQGGVRRGANMGVLRCLGGETLIHTIDGKLPIKDLVGRRPFVYACDSVGRKIHVVQADKVFVSDTDRELVRVWLDSEDFIDCTPDHRFMLKDGSYCEAGSLQSGQRLMAFEKRAIGRSRLAWVVACTEGSADLEHRVVARDVLGMPVSYNEANVHHVDHDTLYNSPSNLQVLSRSDHATAHVSNLLAHQRRITASRRGRKLDEVYDPEKVAQWKERMSQAARRRRAANHRVVKVEPIGYAHEVYDIALPAWHNFAAEEVFVHNCDHPDILEFIDCKRAGGITNFNISIGMTNAFMALLHQSPASQWTLIDPHTQAAITCELSVGEIWRKVLEAAWATGDPGLLFLDRMNTSAANPVPGLGPIEASNPCGEQPLYPFDVCNLGSINLGRFVSKEIYAERDVLCIDWADLEHTVKVATRFLDNVIDVNTYPLPEIDYVARQARRVGLGVMGWADMLMQLNISYASDAAVNLAREVMSRIDAAAAAASVELACERGPFPLWSESIYKDQSPIRNATRTTIAPTGTIGIIADASNGIEPVFEMEFTHDNHQGRVMTIRNWVYQCWLDEHPGQDPSKAVFTTAHEVESDWHVKHQAAFQGYTNNAVSKTINLPHDATVEDVGEAYLAAWDSGCLGITIFRDGSKGGQVLNSAKVSVAKAEELATRFVPNVVHGRTMRIHSPEGTVNVTINDDADGPIELFLNVGRAGSDVSALAEAIGRISSKFLQLPGPTSPRSRLAQLAAQMRGLGGARSVGFGADQVRSVPDAVAAVIGRYLALLEAEETVQNALAIKPMAGASSNSAHGELCPQCSNFSLARSEGCKSCSRCGYSEC